jgi:hypothetical protein
VTRGKWEVFKSCIGSFDIQARFPPKMLSTKGKAKINVTIVNFQYTISFDVI